MKAKPEATIKKTIKNGSYRIVIASGAKQSREEKTMDCFNPDGFRNDERCGVRSRKNVTAKHEAAIKNTVKN